MFTKTWVLNLYQASQIVLAIRQVEEGIALIGIGSRVDLRLEALCVVLSFKVPHFLIVEYWFLGQAYKAYSTQNNMGTGVDHFSLRKVEVLPFKRKEETFLTPQTASTSSLLRSHWWLADDKEVCALLVGNNNNYSSCFEHSGHSAELGVWKDTFPKTTRFILVEYVGKDTCGLSSLGMFLESTGR